MSRVVVRNAGLLESYHVTRHYLGFDSCVVVAAQYTQSGEAPLDRGKLLSAVRNVAKRHLALCVCVAEEAIQPVFIRLDSIKLSDVVSFSEDASGWTGLEQVAAEEFLRSLDTRGDRPLWRLKVLGDNTLVFAWHHCIGDGMSGLAFHRAILKELCSDSLESDVEISDAFRVPANTSLEPPIEAATNVSPSSMRVLREVLNLFIPVSWTKGATAWTGNNVPTIPSLRTHLKLMDFTAADITEFLAICRRHDATLTTAFYAISVSVLSKLIRASDPDTKYRSLCATIPISLRRIAGTSPDVFCEHVSAYMSYPPLDPVFSWENASASTLHSYVSESRETIGVLKYLFGRYADFFKGKLGSKRQTSFEISNVGRFDAMALGEQTTDSSRWNISRIAFAQCDANVGAALKLNVVGAPSGGVTMTVTWGHDAVAGSLAEGFISDFQATFRRILAEAKV